MFIKSLPLLLAIAVVGMIGMFGPNSPAAAQQGPTRSLSSSQVAPGGYLTVTISSLGLAGIGSLDETIPAGFTYIPGDTVVTGGIGSGAISGRVITFTFVGGDTVAYKLQVDSDATPGVYHFSGVLKALGAADVNVGGSTDVTVTSPAPPPTPTVSRSLPASAVAPGSTVEITISNLNKAVGQIEETFPVGLTYVADSEAVVSGANGATVSATVTGQTVAFALVGADSIKYEVTVDSNAADGSYTIAGIFKTVADPVGASIGGDQNLMVEAPPPSPIARTFSADGVDAGVEVTVTISNIGLGATNGFGQVVETLPAGFSYVAGSATAVSGGAGSDVSDAVDGQTVTFTLVSVDSLSYRVMIGADVADGMYTFSGVFKTIQNPAGSSIEDSSLRVGAEPTPTPTPTPVSEPTPTPTPTPGPDEPTDATPTPRPTATPEPPATPVPTEIVDVTAVDGATTVQPNESATVSSADGMATLMLPTVSRARTYQVMVDSDASTCAGVDSLPGSHQAGANVSVYDAEGNMESGVTLIRRATVQMTLSSDAVEDLGGQPVVFQANALGAFSVHQQSAGDNWSMRRSSMGLGDDGAVTVTVTSLSSLGCLALTVDDGLLEQAAFQVAGITPTPVPPPATPVPTATPEPTPTPEPVEEEPKVGDTTAPYSLLIVLALTGALMIYTGARIMRRRTITS